MTETGMKLLDSMAEHPKYGVFELGCRHGECARAYVAEIDRIGLEMADAICVVAEREADAQSCESERGSVDCQIEGIRR